VITVPFLFILLAIVAILVFEYAAVRWGVDSRDGFRISPR